MADYFYYLCLLVLTRCHSAFANPNVVQPTIGAVWPKPFQQISYPSYLALQPHAFKFTQADKYDCSIIDEATRRYYNMIFFHFGITYDNSRLNWWAPSEPWNFTGHLDTLEIYLMSKCELFPHENMDEHYELHLNSAGYEGSGILVARSVWGVLRGLETFSQLVRPINGHQPDTDTTEMCKMGSSPKCTVLVYFPRSNSPRYKVNNGAPNKLARGSPFPGINKVTATSIEPSFFAIRTTSVRDFPRFPHRGLLIDTSRHYLPTLLLMKIIDAMAYSKLNVFHWHIVDDQSFPYQSVQFPSLSENGAYDPYYAVYTQVDIQKIVNHARLRGIRVIPEFDTPGHTLSWGAGLPNFLTPCSDVIRDGPFGPVDPTKDENYRIIQKLFKEVKSQFPDNHFHIGGDEVDFSCWSSNPEINKFMIEHRISNYKELEEFYIQKILNINGQLNLKSIVWQEVFDNGVQLNETTVVHLWTGNYRDELYRVTKTGYNALLSTCWYLDHLDTGGDWLKYYECDPLDFGGTESQKRLVLGGEACMWGEVVDDTNIQQRIWPRACAAAEILWSGPSNVSYASRRLEEHTCRLKKRGIPAQPPNGPNFCPYFFL